MTEKEFTSLLKKDISELTEKEKKEMKEYLDNVLKNLEKG